MTTVFANVKYQTYYNFTICAQHLTSLSIQIGGRGTTAEEAIYK